MQPVSGVPFREATRSGNGTTLSLAVEALYNGMTREGGALSTEGFFDRRAFMKWVIAAPYSGRLRLDGLYAKTASVVARESHGNIYKQIGVKTVINFRGTWTYLQRLAQGWRSRQPVPMS